MFCRNARNRMSEVQTNVKQGAVIGGWISFGLGVLVMAYSTWLVPVYGALLFAAFVLSIVAMAQKRLTGGLILLLASVVVAPGLWLYLTLTRSAHALNKAADYIEQDNLKHGFGIRTHGTPVPRPTAAQAASSVPVRENRAEIADVTQVYNDDLAHADAASIEIKNSKVIDSGGNIARPKACFSADGKLLLYTKASESGNGTVVIAKSLETGETIRSSTVTRQVQNMALSPDNKKVVFFDGENDLHVLDLDAHTDSKLPVDYTHIAFYMPMAWRVDGIIFVSDYETRVLDVDSLRFTQHPFPSRENLDEQRDQAIATGAEHPKCKAYPQQIQNNGAYVGDYVFVANKDFSYAHPVLNRMGQRGEIAISPDLRHVVISNNGQLTVYYLGVGKPNRMSYEIELSSTLLTNSENRELFAKCRSEGVPFRATIYSPQTNPLNGKVIGPNRKGPKAWARIIGWKEQSVLLQTCLEVAAVMPGDIVADIFSDSVGENGYHTAGFGDEWRVITANNSIPSDGEKTSIGNRFYIGSSKKELQDPAAFSYVLRDERQMPVSSTSGNTSILDITGAPQAKRNLDIGSRVTPPISNTEEAQPQESSFAGMWKGSAKSTTGGYSSTASYAVRISPDERTVWTNWDDDANGFESRAHRTRDTLTWSLQQHPGSAGFSSWKMNCSLTFSGANTAQFNVTTLNIAGRYKGTRGKIAGILSRRSPPPTPDSTAPASNEVDAFEADRPATATSTPSDANVSAFLNRWTATLSSTDIYQIASAYADPVDYDDEGLLSRSKLLKSLRAYYARWPVQNITLTTQPTVETLNATDSRASFEIQFDASDPASGRRSRGVAQMTVVVRQFGNSDFHIVTTRERILRRF
jgi:hypothetical protein